MKLTQGIERRFRKPKHTRGLIKKDSSKEFFFLSFFRKNHKPVDLTNLGQNLRHKTFQCEECSVDEQVKKQKKTNKQTNKQKKTNKRQTKKTKQKRHDLEGNLLPVILIVNIRLEKLLEFGQYAREIISLATI